jgi:hypothetical protein
MPSQKRLRMSGKLLALMWELAGATEFNEKDPLWDKLVANAFGGQTITYADYRRERKIDRGKLDRVRATLKAAGTSISHEEAICREYPLPDNHNFYNGHWYSYYVDYGRHHSLRGDELHSTWWPEEISLNAYEITNGVVIRGECKNFFGTKFKLKGELSADGNLGLSAKPVNDKNPSFHAVLTACVDVKMLIDPEKLQDAKHTKLMLTEEQCFSPSNETNTCSDLRCLLGMWIGHNAYTQACVCRMIMTRRPVRDMYVLKKIASHYEIASLEDEKLIYHAIPAIKESKSVLSVPDLGEQLQWKISNVAAKSVRNLPRHKAEGSPKRKKQLKRDASL